MRLWKKRVRKPQATTNEGQGPVIQDQTLAHLVAKMEYTSLPHCVWQLGFSPQLCGKIRDVGVGPSSDNIKRVTNDLLIWPISPLVWCRAQSELLFTVYKFTLSFPCFLHSTLILAKSCFKVKVVIY